MNPVISIQGLDDYDLAVLARYIDAVQCERAGTTEADYTIHCYQAAVESLPQNIIEIL